MILLLIVILMILGFSMILVYDEAIRVKEETTDVDTMINDCENTIKNMKQSINHFQELNKKLNYLMVK